jgi:integrase/recombinase XerD
MSPATRDALAERLADHQDWLRIERGLAANSVAAYRRDLAQYATFLRDRQITDPGAVDERAVNEYVGWLQAARTNDGLPRFKAASIARALAAVRSFHRFCVAESAAPDNPALDVGTPRVPQGLPKALTEDEVEALLGAVAGDTPTALRDRAILETLYATGLRISELVGLDLDDLDLERGFVRAFGKGGKERVVPVGRTARRAVTDYLERGRPELARPRRGDPAAVFLNARGGRMSRQWCWQILRRCGERVGLGERVHPHVLRHSIATHMLDRGADVRVVQELLGHATLSTTQVYTKVFPRRLRAVVDAAHPRSRRAPA